MPKNRTTEEYKKYVEKKSPKSSKIRHVFMAFLIGGLICIIAQLLTGLYINAGLEAKTAATASTVSVIFLGALLTGLGIYDKIAKYAGAGTLVPITGFANSIVSAAMEFKSEGFIQGLGAKMFVIAGPVIVFGTIASSVWGLIYYLFIQ